LRLSNTRVRQGASLKTSIFYAYKKHIKKYLTKTNQGLGEIFGRIFLINDGLLSNSKGVLHANPAG
jgi:hypothetical protein